MARSYIRRRGDRRRQTKPRRIRVLVPKFYDPYWWIQGSSIEKMVMTEFARRNIYFEHTPQTNNLGGLVDPSWEPDFLLPQFQIWLEIQGGYFHTLPGQVEHDAFRFAAIEQTGWRPIWYWENDIRTRLTELMNETPEFYAAQPDTSDARRTPGLNFYEGGDGVDHLAGLRKALANRARPIQLKSRVKTVRRAK